MSLEAEMRELSDNLNRQEKTHYEHKIHQDKEAAFDEEGRQRHDQEVDLYTVLKTKKEKELADLNAALIKLEKDFAAMKDYQNALAETAELRAKIEAAKVRVDSREYEHGHLQSDCQV